MSGSAAAAEPEVKSRPMPRDVKILNAAICIFAFLSRNPFPLIQRAMSKDLETATFFGAIFSIVMLLGSVTFSRLSDMLPRRNVMVAGLLGWMVSQGFWICFPDSLWPVMPGAFFGHGAMSISQPLYGDYGAHNKNTDEEGAQWSGTISAMIALATVFSPFVGQFMAAYPQYLIASTAVGTGAAVVPLLLMLDPPNMGGAKKKGKVTLTELVNIKVARTPAGLWLLGWTFLLLFTFSTCQVIMLPLMKARFGGNDAADAQMFSQLGGVNALGATLGFMLAPRVIGKFCVPYADRVIAGLFVLIGATRVLMFWTGSYPCFLFAAFAWATIGVGLINPIRAGMMYTLVPSSELGGYSGLLFAVEGVSGFLGPMMARSMGMDLSPSISILGFITVYASTPVVAYFGYKAWFRPVVDSRGAAAALAKADKTD